MTTTTDDNIMTEMLERVTRGDGENIDELAVQMFCLVVRSNKNLVTKAQELLLSKIRSNNIAESTKGIALLEECMSKCGDEFQTEAAKFRFLNELIRLVSKRYQGNSTPERIKQRIMECLLLWTTQFPQRTKIREAYDMLNKEGCVEHGNSANSVGKRECVLGIDEDMLAKLIKSNDPENFKRANLLIQYQVNQESRRTELNLQHKSEIEGVQNIVILLNQMLDTYESDKIGAAEDNDTLNLLKDLYSQCKKQKPVLQRLPELMENIDESLIAETLEVNDALQGVMNRYKEIVAPTQEKKSKEAVKTSNADLLLSLLNDEKTNVKNTSTDSSQKKNELRADNGNVLQKNRNAFETNTLDELSELFGSKESEHGVITTSKYPDDLLNNLDILKPVSVFQKRDKEESVTQKVQSERMAFRELREIDNLSNELFRQNLITSERTGTFKKKDSEKRTLNELVKEKHQIQPERSVSIPALIKAKNEMPKHEEEKTELTSCLELTASTQDDDEILGTLNKSNDSQTSTVSLEKNKILESGEVISVVPMPIQLSKIEIDWDELMPSGVEKVIYDDDDVKIVFSHTENRPGENVSVIVIAVTNKSKLTLKDFQLEASVKKPCRLRLLTPTDSTIPPYKPYRPPAPINQILMLFNPTGRETDVICIFGYRLGDDPDPIRESIVAKNIPYVE